MFKMINPVRDYAWGSTTAFRELFGWAASATPQAELWMGAHPSGPSLLELPSDGVQGPGEITSLPEYLHDSAQSSENFPFLLKVLAAEQPLSIQSHPTAERARLGFAAEETAGIARDAAHRSYKDPHAKPELIVALTEFSALCGFRPYTEAATVLESLRTWLAGLGHGGAEQQDHPQLRSVLDRLHSCVVAQDYAAALEQLLGSHRDESVIAAGQLHGMLDPVAGPRREGEAGGITASLDPGTRGMLDQVSAAFPQDPGIFVTLLLNRVQLAPGESIYLPAGNLHAYLHGVGVELMGNSDNVLRGGLTGKHLDVEELLSVTDFGVLPVPHCPVQRSHADPRRTSYQAPFEEFALERFELPGEATLERSGPGIVLCTAGELTLHAPRGTGDEWAPPNGTGVGAGLTSGSEKPHMLTLTPGESAFLPDTAGHRLSAAAHAQAFLASSTFASTDRQEYRP
ncbi:mannose-6-phosphate isomerase, class I [Nesterenkonia sp. E16_7]|uniref:mannose-6-phosphate isomerase, class I n=1 Tax=unclassified Nesterenkonia TaxID=2629769 RepID=UPI001A920277|nr:MULTISPECIES: mannose-6-phosphate isomerase, class I [unclassified Nesterenkonia]MBO0594510.1 mannose-6-phosphate isomerase, class I [Nesterenkonia sp. E16_10]MBO0597282.1 mannose-6-phosphate isomerase, class I [Nesterenkonia sp. E16_7]